MDLSIALRWFDAAISCDETEISVLLSGDMQRSLGLLGLVTSEGDGAAVLVARSLLADDKAAACLTQMLRAGCDPESTNKEGKTLLCIASELGHIECVKVLIGAGANVEGAGYSLSPLALATEAGRVEVVEALIAAGCDVDAAVLGRTSLMHDETSDTALIRACWLDNEEAGLACMKMLLNAGASMERCDSEGNQAAMICAKKGHANKLMQLIKAGCDLEQKDQSGRGMLHAAAHAGSLSTLTALVSAGSDINAHSPNGDAVAKFAILGGNEACLAALVDAGCELDKDGSRDLGLLRAAAGLGRVEMARSLVAWGVDINEREPYSGQTPAKTAIAMGQPETLANLIEMGCTLDPDDLLVKKFSVTASTSTGYEQCLSIVRAQVERRRLKEDVDVGLRPIASNS